MTDAWASIIVAIIGLFGSITVVLLSKFRKENKDDHGRVRDILDALHDDVKEVGKKIDNHIEWHLDNK